MAFLPNPFDIKPVQIPNLPQFFEHYDQSFEIFLSDDNIYFDWRDGGNSPSEFLIIENDKDEQWARLFDKTIRKLREIEDKTSQYDELMEQNKKYLEEINLLKSKIFAPSTEQSNQKETESTTSEEISQSEPTAQQSKPKKIRDPKSYTGRTPIPENLPRDEINYDIPLDERKCPCCDGKIHYLGKDISEKVIEIPREVRVKKIIRYKYVCHACNEFYYGKMPKSMLPGSNYDDPSFVSSIAIQKFFLGLPYYRIAQYYNSINIPFNRSTMAKTICDVADRLYPLTEALRNVLVQQNVIHADETTLQVLKEPGRKPQTKSYIWTYLSGKHEENQILLFDYQQTRSGEHPTNFLTTSENSFNGYLITDGYAGYNNIPNVTRVGCMAHLRRKFDEALKALSSNVSDSNAKKAIDLIGELYGIEDKIKDEPPDKIFQIRQKVSLPKLKHLKIWLDEMQLSALPKMLFGKAINYALKQWLYVERYVENGELPIDNNAVERAIKQFVIGRKNWLFSDSVDGAHANATMYSLVGTAIANGLDPYKYLEYVLNKFPNMDRSEDISILFPWNVSLD